MLTKIILSVIKVSENFVKIPFSKFLTTDQSFFASESQDFPKI